ncbi:sigma 54-interacting transcriptional regulator [Pseudomonas putida]|uniref:sigma 54-interacting transcriptional regulator n=1 Tax=Pseudomonas putida TaxID=303 RepID=UPI00300EAC06
MPGVRAKQKAAHAPTIVGEGSLSLTSEVLKRLHFNPAEGLIWLEDRRMMLMHAEAMGALRQELIEGVGTDAARGLLTRFGYTAGCRDAELALALRGRMEAVDDLLGNGAQFQALQGIVTVEGLYRNVDIERGICHLEFLWRNCFEDQVHIDAYGIGAEAVCWIEVGYASGFLSTCMGKRILVREIACRAMGEEVCHCVARPIEDWPDPEEDLKYFEPGPIRNHAHAKVHASPSVDAREQSSNAKGAAPSVPRASVIGASVSFNVIMHKILRVAPTKATVLLLGESGVGKSAFAREIQRASRRADKPFLEVNCAAIPEQLMESELFGVERGAYTGAAETRPGRFQLADGGTLFLDEIATLSLTAQGKLLRVLQTGEFETLGGRATRQVDVRIVAATNEDLRDAVKAGRFREDLYYRLNVFPILIPPLRERRDDIPLLLEYMIRRYSALHERRICGVTSQALQVVLNYRWPGNIRELENVIERGVILGEDDQPLGYSQLFTLDGEAQERSTIGLNELGMLTEQHIPTAALTSPGERRARTDALEAWADSIVKGAAISLDDVENSLVKAAFNAAGGNLSKAAGLLGVTRAQLAYRAKKLELPEDSH